MLSVFPSILFLAPLSAFLIRIALAIVLLLAAKKHWSNAETPSRILAAVELAAAISVGVGALAQVGALVGAVVIIYWIARPAVRPISYTAILLSLVLCVSLLITGAGPFAFDWPL
ncbi:MAG: hypothetical protein Q7S01_03200 [bacterium]|nr:hypothetical protein [bacterium]